MVSFLFSFFLYFFSLFFLFFFCFFVFFAWAKSALEWIRVLPEQRVFSVIIRSQGVVACECLGNLKSGQLSWVTAFTCQKEKKKTIEIPRPDLWKAVRQECAWLKNWSHLLVCGHCACRVFLLDSGLYLQEKSLRHRWLFTPQAPVARSRFLSCLT